MNRYSPMKQKQHQSQLQYQSIDCIRTDSKLTPRKPRTVVSTRETTTLSLPFQCSFPFCQYQYRLDFQYPYQHSQQKQQLDHFKSKFLLLHHLSVLKMCTYQLSSLPLLSCCNNQKQSFEIIVIIKNYILLSQRPILTTRMDTTRKNSKIINNSNYKNIKLISYNGISMMSIADDTTMTTTTTTTSSSSSLITVLNNTFNDNNTNYQNNSNTTIDMIHNKNYIHNNNNHNATKPSNNSYNNTNATTTTDNHNNSTIYRQQPSLQQSTVSTVQNLFEYKEDQHQQNQKQQSRQQQQQNKSNESVQTVLQHYRERKDQWAAKYTSVETLRTTFGISPNGIWGDLDIVTTRRLYKTLLPRALLALHCLVITSLSLAASASSSTTYPNTGNNPNLNTTVNIGTSISRPTASGYQYSANNNGHTSSSNSSYRHILRTTIEEELAPLAYQARVAAKLYARERCIWYWRIASNLYDGLRQYIRFGTFDINGISYQQLWNKYATDIIQQQQQQQQEEQQQQNDTNHINITNKIKQEKQQETGLNGIYMSSSNIEGQNDDLNSDDNPEDNIESITNINNNDYSKSTDLYSCDELRIDDDFVARISLKILEKSCQTNPTVDRLVLRNYYNDDDNNNNKSLQQQNQRQQKQRRNRRTDRTMEDDIRRITELLEADVRKLLGQDENDIRIDISEPQYSNKPTVSSSDTIATEISDDSKVQFCTTRKSVVESNSRTLYNEESNNNRNIHVVKQQQQQQPDLDLIMLRYKAMRSCIRIRNRLQILRRRIKNDNKL